VDEVEVKVLKTELLQTVIQSSLDLLGVVLRVPELRGNEDILSLEARDLSKGLLQGLGDLGLVSVDLGQIQVSVANLEGLVDTLTDLTGGGLPCAISQETENN